MSPTRPARKRKLNFKKCRQCRTDKKDCAPQDRQWPTRCDRCIKFGYQCSPSQLKSEQSTNGADAEAAPKTVRERSTVELIESWACLTGLSIRNDSIGKGQQNSEPEALLEPLRMFDGNAEKLGCAIIESFDCVFQRSCEARRHGRIWEAHAIITALFANSGRMSCPEAVCSHTQDLIQARIELLRETISELYSELGLWNLACLTYPPRSLPEQILEKANASGLKHLEDAGIFIEKDCNTDFQTEAGSSISPIPLAGAGNFDMLPSTAPYTEQMASSQPEVEPQPMYNFGPLHDKIRRGAYRSITMDELPPKDRSLPIDDDGFNALHLLLISYEGYFYGHDWDDISSLAETLAGYPQAAISSTADGRTPLHICAAKLFPPIQFSQLLLSYGANPYTIDSWDELRGLLSPFFNFKSASPLCVLNRRLQFCDIGLLLALQQSAMTSTHVPQSLEELMEFLKCVRNYTSVEWTALKPLIINTIRQALQQGIDVNHVEQGKRTLVTWIIIFMQFDDLPILQLLVEFGANLWLMDGLGNHPLFEAIKTHNTAIVEFIAERRLDDETSKYIEQSGILNDCFQYVFTDPPWIGDEIREALERLRTHITRQKALSSSHPPVQAKTGTVQGNDFQPEEMVGADDEGLVCCDNVGNSDLHFTFGT